MARSKFALDFKGFLDYAREVDELGKGYLKKAVENALTKSKEYANNEILNAMDSSPFQFGQGGTSKVGVGKIAAATGGYNRPATGRAKKSTIEASKMPIEWEGNKAFAYIGADLELSPEALILINGSPHIAPDRNLYNASKVKGKYRKKVDEIQMEEFQKVIDEAFKNG